MLTRFGVNAEWRLEQVVQPLGDIDVQPGVGIL